MTAARSRRRAAVEPLRSEAILRRCAPIVHVNAPAERPERPERAARRIGPLTGFAVQGVAAVVIATLLFTGAEWGAGAYLARRQAELLAANAALAQRDFVSGVLAWMDVNPVPLAPDPELLWRNRPGAEKTQFVNPQAFGRPRSWTATLDARGYRDGPADLPVHHAGVYRVLCVGDSITYGFNVDSGDTYPQQLEALLARRHPGRRFQVINAGVPGWSWAQGRRFLELEGLALRPDVVVIAHGTNDQFFPTMVTDLERIGRGQGRLARAGRRLAARLARTNLHRLAMLVSPRREGPSAGCAAQPAGACRRLSIPEVEATVVDVARETRAAGVDLVLWNGDFMETPAVEGLRPAAAVLGVPFLDLVARFRALRENAEERRARELGLNAAGPLDAPAHGGPREVILRVTGAPPGALLSVTGAGYLQDAFRFDLPLRDDGTAGDERAGDGVFTARVEVPPEIGAIEHRFVADGVPELAPLPPFPSGQGLRLLRVGVGVRAPVEVFGELAYMTERTHPNAAGHAIVAAAVADAIGTLPSFRRFLDPVPQGAAAESASRQ